MKNLDTFCKRVLISSISIGIVFISLSLFLFSLTTVSKSFADSPKKMAIFKPKEMTDDEGYQIIGYTPSVGGLDGYHWAVGYNRNLPQGQRIAFFK